MMDSFTPSHLADLAYCGSFIYSGRNFYLTVSADITWSLDYAVGIESGSGINQYRTLLRIDDHPGFTDAPAAMVIS